jgi:hypothetical protein
VPEDGIFCGLPAAPFESVEKCFRPAEFKFFVPVSPSGINLPRERIINEIKAQGFDRLSYVSSRAALSPGGTIAATQPEKLKSRARN